MSYTLDLENDYLVCRSKEAADKAAALINTDPWMRHHLQVSPVCRSSPERDDAWQLVLDEYDGCAWKEDPARQVWFALTPFMAEGATMEFCTEDRSRFRIHWRDGRVFEEYPKDIIWAVECELTGQEDT